MLPSGALKAFAEARDLTYRSTGQLPPHGNLLSRGGRVEGLVEGLLPGGVDGKLAYLTYTYTTTDSDGHSETDTRRFTIVVTSIPQSIGFMPALGFAGAESETTGLGDSLADLERVDLGGHAGLKGSRCFRYRGASEMWPRRLSSPALIDWLARSEADLGFELADGVLTTSRKGHLGDAAALTGLCEEAAHLTAAIAAESDQDANAGTAVGNAAKDPKATDPRMEAALREIPVDPPASVKEAVPTFRSHLARSPRIVGRALRRSLLIALLINIPAAAIPIVFALEGFYLALAIIEALLVGALLLYIYRRALREGSEKYAAEAFWRNYAGARGLRIVEPLHFAATHAEAKLPFRPDRALEGALPGGGEGCFCVYGDGSKRADRVAVVGGPAGPVAESELEAEPQGLTAKDLDTYLEQLAGELRSASPGTAALPAASEPR